MEMKNSTPSVIGLSDGQFYRLHIPSLCCICLSFISVILVLIASLCLHRRTPFFTWGKSDRFVVYIAITNGVFCIIKACDHVQVLITKDGVKPRILCVFYSFVVETIIGAQLLFELYIAINAFIMMRYSYSIKFGRKDWRLLVGTFALPIITTTLTAALGQLGMTGVYCGVTGNIASLITSTIPMTMIFIINSVLYVATWYDVRKRAKIVRGVVSGTSQSTRGYHNAAKIMTLFVVAFFLHWWALTMNGIVELSGRSHVILLELVTIFTNLGGFFNGIVFLIIEYLKKRNKEFERKSANARKMSLDIAINTTSANF